MSPEMLVLDKETNRFFPIRVSKVFNISSANWRRCSCHRRANISSREEWDQRLRDKYPRQIFFVNIINIHLSTMFCRRHRQRTSPFRCHSPTAKIRRSDKQRPTSRRSRPGSIIPTIWRRLVTMIFVVRSSMPIGSNASRRRRSTITVSGAFVSDIESKALDREQILFFSFLFFTFDSARLNSWATNSYLAVLMIVHTATCTRVLLDCCIYVRREREKDAEQTKRSYVDEEEEEDG